MGQAALLRNSEHDLITKVHDHDVGQDSFYNPSHLFRGGWKWKIERSLQITVKGSHAVKGSIW